MAETLGTPAGAAGETNDQHRDSDLISVTRGVARATKCWTPALVEERLRKAVALQAALATGRPVAGIVEGRPPKTIGIIGGIGGMGSEPPADDDHGLLAHAAEALSWLRCLEPDDAALVRARLAGAPWKSICWRFAISRPTADRRWRYALAIIVWRLSGHTGADETPSLRCLLGMRRRMP